MPVVDGWHADRHEPSQADFDELAAVAQDIPAPEAMRDPRVRAAYAAAVKAQLASPVYRRVQAYIDWSTGSGACVPIPATAGFKLELRVLPRGESGIPALVTVRFGRALGTTGPGVSLEVPKQLAVRGLIVDIESLW